MWSVPHALVGTKAIPHHVWKTDNSRGVRHWQSHHWTAKHTKRKTCVRTEATWIQSRLFTSLKSRHGVNAKDVKIISPPGVNDGAKPGQTTKHRPDFPRTVRTLAPTNQEEGKTNPQLSFYVKTTSSFANLLHIRMFLQSVSLTNNSDSLVNDGRCVQNRTPRL